MALRWVECRPREKANTTPPAPRTHAFASAVPRYGAKGACPATPAGHGPVQEQRLSGFQGTEHLEQIHVTPSVDGVMAVE